MARHLQWMKTEKFEGFGCSECSWVFNPSDALAGKSLEDMKKNFEDDRDKHFAAHVCEKRIRGDRLTNK
ncbi:MAG: hypothetical protein NVS9B13_15240 [Candidatus Acidiferrum sp.]